MIEKEILFADIKPGDLVASRGGWPASVILGEVQRVTAKQFVVGGRHYWKESGRLVGGTWRDKVIPVTQELIAEAKAQDDRNRLTKAVESRAFPLTAEEVALMLEALDAHRAKKKQVSP